MFSRLTQKNDAATKEQALLHNLGQKHSMFQRISIAKPV
jgi:hypothetical protein